MVRAIYPSTSFALILNSFVGIRVDVTTQDGRKVTGLMTHEDLEEIVGDSIASFVNQMVKGNVPAGVFFPE